MAYGKGNKSGNRFKPGETGNPAGRPKKLLSQLKDLGYKESQVLDTLNVLFALGIDELQKIEKSGEHTALERTVAAAIVSGFKKKSQYNMMQLIERIYGKPKESVSHELSGTIEVTLDLGHGAETND